MTNYEDAKQTTYQLAEIMQQCPADFYFIKGYIHCAIEKQKQAKKRKEQTNARINEL